MNNEEMKENLNLDSWNKRLDDNLENAKEGNTLADEKAEEFNDKYGSDALREQQKADDVEDNMKINQPKPGTPIPGEIEREE